MVLDATLLNTQQYKVRIKGQINQSREWSSALPNTKVANFTYIMKHVFRKTGIPCVTGIYSYTWTVRRTDRDLQTHPHEHMHSDVHVYIFT